MVTEVAMECAPRITIPASVSFTTPGCRNGSECLWAGVERSIWGGTMA